MELKEYLKILRKNLNVFIGTILIVLAVTYIYTIKTPPTYYTASSILLNRKSTFTPQAQYFQYDSYFAIQSAALLANAISSWLQSPATVLEIYQRAKIIPPSTSLSKLSKIFKIRKQTAETNIIDISISEKDKEKSEKLMQEALKMVEEKTNQVAKSSGVAESFEVLSSNPVTISSKPDLVINLSVAAVVSIILGLILVFMKKYLEKNDK